MRVLLVEDDPMIADAVCIALKDAAYSVDWVRDGIAVRSALDQSGHEAMLLDLGLPGCDGLDVLRGVRAAGHRIPVVILTARDAVEDRVRGLDLGADDYIVKPFQLEELLARLRAVIRRRGGHASATLSNGVLTLDPATREARRGEATCLLSAREFALLHVLMQYPGRVFARAELEDRIYGWNEEVQSNAVEYLIHAVRRKLGADAILNMRGAGWMVENGRANFVT